MKAKSNKLRIWSAGCSSGEEPYTLAIVIKEAYPDADKMDIKILATDISTKVLGIARDGIYSQDVLRDVSPELARKYFTCIQAKTNRTYKVNADIKSMVRLARLNLMEPWPMKGPFDAIFCRNVMIYFDKPTQQELVRRYWELLVPGEI